MAVSQWQSESSSSQYDPNYSSSQYDPSYTYGYPPGYPWHQTNLGQKPKLGGVRISHRLYIHVHTLILVVGAHTFSLYHPCQFILFSSILLVCLKNLKENQKIVVAFSQFTLHACSSNKLKKTQKDFSFFFCLLGAFPCKQFYFFSFLWGRQEKTIIKLLKWLLYALLLI